MLKQKSGTCLRTHTKFIPVSNALLLVVCVCVCVCCVCVYKVWYSTCSSMYVRMYLKLKLCKFTIEN